VSALAEITAISAGSSHSLALRNDGTVWAWGYNNSGQLGDGTIRLRTTPIQLPGLAGITAITAGGVHSLALRGDGTVLAWGGNSQSQIGDGTPAVTLPSPVVFEEGSARRPPSR
jgi:alpha-tubulin suppressor-like RCC1 family protein